MTAGKSVVNLGPLGQQQRETRAGQDAAAIRRASDSSTQASIFIHTHSAGRVTVVSGAAGNGGDGLLLVVQSVAAGGGHEDAQGGGVEGSGGWVG
jgi:hypothetical protein